MPWWSASCKAKTTKGRARAYLPSTTIIPEKHKMSALLRTALLKLNKMETLQRSAMTQNLNRKGQPSREPPQLHQRVSRVSVRQETLIWVGRRA